MAGRHYLKIFDDRRKDDRRKTAGVHDRKARNSAASLVSSR
jgi:hypothetical protein